MIKYSPKMCALVRQGECKQLQPLQPTHKKIHATSMREQPEALVNILVRQHLQPTGASFTWFSQRFLPGHPRTMFETKHTKTITSQLEHFCLLSSLRPLKLRFKILFPSTHSPNPQKYLKLRFLLHRPGVFPASVGISTIPPDDGIKPPQTSHVFTARTNIKLSALGPSSWLV